MAGNETYYILEFNRYDERPNLWHPWGPNGHPIRFDSPEDAYERLYKYSDMNASIIDKIRPLWRITCVKTSCYTVFTYDKDGVR